MGMSYEGCEGCPSPKSPIFWAKKHMGWIPVSRRRWQRTWKSGKRTRTPQNLDQKSADLVAMWLPPYGEISQPLEQFFSAGGGEESTAAEAEASSQGVQLELMGLRISIVPLTHCLYLSTIFVVQHVVSGCEFNLLYVSAVQPVVSILLSVAGCGQGRKESNQERNARTVHPSFIRDGCCLPTEWLHFACPFRHCWDVHVACLLRTQKRQAKRNEREETWESLAKEDRSRSARRRTSPWLSWL